MPSRSFPDFPVVASLVELLLYSPGSLRFRKPKYAYLSGFTRRFSLGPLRVLDIGVANNSKEEWLRVFADTCQYDGLDWCEPPGFMSDQEVCASTFYCVDLDRVKPSAVIAGYYNVICISHVLEHLQRPYEVLRDLLGLLAPGGIVYLEFPNYSSLCRNFISSYDFYGDSTHVQPLDSRFVIEEVRGLGIQVCEHGRCLTLGKVVFSSLFSLSRLVAARRGWRDSLLYVAGMVDYCVLRKH